jgi:hypothetical protein
MTYEDVRPGINKSVLTVYRTFSIISLYGVLVAVLGFASLCAFYAISSTWVAPVILTQADKDTLDLTGKTLQTQNAVQDLSLDIEKLEKTVAEAEGHKAALEQIRPAIDEAIARENRHKRETGPVLATLDQQKTVDDARTQAVLAKTAELESSIDKELAIGLINKNDALQAKMVLAKSNGELTDSKIATTLLKDTILEKTVPTTTYLEILHRKAELESEITNLDITITTAQKQIATEKGQVAKFVGALEAARETPMWVAMRDGRANLALVPYENQAVAIKGTPVYDCYLSFIVCRQVGTLRATFVGEQHAIHPVFRTDLRGFIVQLDLDHPDSAKSKTLFLGKKPLWL